jgi:MarR family transcriptional regulator, lower aerobic nicotinate degradation pathway regulator
MSRQDGEAGRPQISGVTVEQTKRPSGQNRKRNGYRLEAQIGFALRQASQRHAAIFARMAQITPTQWAALVKLNELGVSSQNRLGRETAMDVATIKGVVDRLLARGYIESSQDPKDGRRRTLRLTETGIQLVEQTTPVARRITRQTVRGLSESECATLIRLLRKIS